MLVADAVLLDLDGVLVDSTAGVEQAWTRFARRHDLDPDALLEDLHGRRMVDIIRRALPHLDEADLREEAERVQSHEVELGASVTPVDGAPGLVASLREDRWAIVTSGTRPVAEARLRGAGLPRPSVFVTADDVEEGKPSPVPYRTAAAHLGVDPARCVVVEDAPAGVAAGRAAGATTVAVSTSHTPAELDAADHVVRTTGAIRRLPGRGLVLSLEVVDDGGPRDAAPVAEERRDEAPGR